MASAHIALSPMRYLPDSSVMIAIIASLFGCRRLLGQVAMVSNKAGHGAEDDLADGGAKGIGDLE